MADICAKIALRRRLDPIVTIGKIHIIEVELQNILFGIFLFQFYRNIHFLDLSFPGLFVGKKDRTRQLLGNGTSALGHLTVLDHGDHGTHNAPVINSLVLVKALILGTDDCLLDVDRNVFVFYVVDILFPFEHRQGSTIDIVGNTGLVLAESILGGMGNQADRLRFHGTDLGSIASRIIISHCRYHQQHQYHLKF